MHRIELVMRVDNKSAEEVRDLADRAIAAASKEVPEAEFNRGQPVAVCPPSGGSKISQNFEAATSC